MRWTYHCPKCDGVLNPGGTIVLVASHGETRILMGFHPEPGNYEVYLPPGFEVAPRSFWSFACPLCHGGLATTDNASLSTLDLVEAGARRKVLFSSIAGERATYVVSERKVERFGEHAEAYAAHMAQMKYLLP